MAAFPPPPMPPGYRFFRIVIIVGAIGFGLLGAFYLLGGQTAPGLFALFVAAVEAAALPLLRKLFEASKAPVPDDRDDSAP